MQLIRAKKLIPLIRPSIVVMEIQRSGIDRSQSHFLATWPTHLALPYYSEGVNGNLTVNNPVYQAALATQVNILPGDSFSFSALLRTIWFGSILQITDHKNFLAFLSRKHLIPSTNRENILNHTINEITKLCTANGSRLILIKLSPVEEIGELENLVDGYSALYSNLNPSESFEEKYFISDGIPKQIVDNHFNGSANYVIAERIVHRLKTEVSQITNEKF